MNKIQVQEKYYVYQDENENYSDESKIFYLKYLISLNETVYDPYVELMDIYFRLNQNEEAVKIIQNGYNALMKNEFDGKLPNELNYYELHNRPIFRVLYNYADTYWFIGNKKEALKLFKKLLRMHPSDNIGIRYAICGILENYQCTNHIWNEHDQNIDKWFKEKIKKHLKTRGFGWLKTYLSDPK